MRSMTGYGRCSVQSEGRQMTVELKSVNHRFLDISLRVSRGVSFLEEEARRALSARVSRGHVDVYISYQNQREDAKTVVVDHALLAAHLNALGEIAELSGAPAGATAIELSKLPDVLSVKEAEEDQDAVLALFKQVMDAALDELIAMREREGVSMRTDLCLRADNISAQLAQITERAPQTVAEYQLRLRERLSALLGGAVDEGRLITEVAVMAEKSDIAEETVRLTSHIAQLHELVEAEEPVGRKLDFLVQEFNREVNTISSKSQDIPITRAALDMKSEIEKLREQLQNVE